MRFAVIYFFSFLALSSCATDAPPASSVTCEELNTATVIASPPPVAGRYHPNDRDKIDRGAYMIELLGCGSCHTNGAFDGEPDMDRALAGSPSVIHSAKNSQVSFIRPILRRMKRPVLAPGRISKSRTRFAPVSVVMGVDVL